MKAGIPQKTKANTSWAKNVWAQVRMITPHVEERTFLLAPK